MNTFLLPLSLLSIFITLITKKVYYTSSDGINITFDRCDLYDGLDSFVLSTFPRIKLKYVTTTKKSACLLLLLLCADIESQPGLTNNSEFKTLMSKKGIKILEVCMEKLTKFEKFSLSETSISEDFHNAFPISEGTVSSEVIDKKAKVEV